jgi:hypothetical protein
VAGCRLVGCSVVSGQPLRSRAVAGVSQRVRIGLGPPVPRPCLLQPRPPCGGGVGFPWRGEVWAEEDLIGVFGGEEEGGVVRSGPGG